MRFLVIGSGAREHALCRSLATSAIVSEVYCAPGNPGIARDAKIVDMALDDYVGLLRFCLEKEIDLVVIGPERPLVGGIVDLLSSKGIRAFGPSMAAARLEGSKAFTKEFCARHGIPTAAYRVFERRDRGEAILYVSTRGPPIVVKADGLAAGKGVVVAETSQQAVEAVSAILDDLSGSAGDRVVIEEYLEGEEASLFAVCDGSQAIEFGTAQDHKRAFDGDRGPNTGGMGAYSPAPILTPLMIERIMSEIVSPTIRGMAAEGAPFVGFLYAGLMITSSGPKLIEYNVRFGDPECQVVLPRLKSDLGVLLLGSMNGSLADVKIDWHPEPMLGVVLASRGYPGPHPTGTELQGLEQVERIEGLSVFHAATLRDGQRWLSAGGRVATIAAKGATLSDARELAYRGVDMIDWPEGFCRRDIGWRAIR